MAAVHHRQWQGRAHRSWLSVTTKLQRRLLSLTASRSWSLLVKQLVRRSAQKKKQLCWRRNVNEALPKPLKTTRLQQLRRD